MIPRGNRMISVRGALRRALPMVGAIVCGSAGLHLQGCTSCEKIYCRHAEVVHNALVNDMLRCCEIYDTGDQEGFSSCQLDHVEYARVVDTRLLEAYSACVAGDRETMREILKNLLNPLNPIFDRPVSSVTALGGEPGNLVSLLPDDIRIEITAAMEAQSQHTAKEGVVVVGGATYLEDAAGQAVVWHALNTQGLGHLPFPDADLVGNDHEVQAVPGAVDSTSARFTGQFIVTGQDVPGAVSLTINQMEVGCTLPQDDGDGGLTAIPTALTMKGNVQGSSFSISLDRTYAKNSIVLDAQHTGFIRAAVNLTEMPEIAKYFILEDHAWIELPVTWDPVSRVLSPAQTVVSGSDLFPANALLSSMTDLDHVATYDSPGIGNHPCGDEDGDGIRNFVESRNFHFRTNRPSFCN